MTSLGKQRHESKCLAIECFNRNKVEALAECAICSELRVLHFMNGNRVVPAEEQYNRRDKQKGQKSCLTPKLKKEIENGLKSSWSPEQICGPLSAWTKANGSF